MKQAKFTYYPSGKALKNKQKQLRIKVKSEQEKLWSFKSLRKIFDTKNT